jgi:hypothetical protein
VCSWIVAVDVLAADALADALAVGEAVDWDRLVCSTVVLCGVVVACANVVSPVVVVPVCPPVVPAVEVVVPVVGVVVPVVVLVVPVVPVVRVVDSGREVVDACSWRFATVGPFSPLIPRLMVAFEELSIAPVSTLAHSCSVNTLTTARPRPSGLPPACTFCYCAPPRGATRVARWGPLFAITGKATIAAAKPKPAISPITVSTINRIYLPPLRPP